MAQSDIAILTNGTQCLTLWHNMTVRPPGAWSVREMVMKVVALGGAGDVGRTAVREAARLKGLTSLVVADLDIARARALGDSLAGGAVEVTAAQADVGSDLELDALLADADVVLNMVGPFYRFGAPVLDAAIRTRTHYLDICDDWEPTMDLLSRDAEARASGITAIIGMGGSPGALNLLAVCAARALDEVRDLYIAWPIDLPMPGETAAMNNEDVQADALLRRAGPSAAVVHWMQQVSGSIRTVEGGVEVDTAPLVAVELNYPGLGRGAAYTVGHPEPLTLRRSLALRGQSACLMVISPMLAAAANALRGAVDAGHLSVEAAAARLGEGGPPPTLVAGGGYASHGALPTFFALARGLKDDRPATAGARVTAFPRGLAAGTAVPLVIVLRDLIEGRIRRRGVFAPEEVVEPNSFFAELTRRCAPPGAASIVTVDVDFDI
jgi:lysine 6-dehydrogenase